MNVLVGFMIDGKKGGIDKFLLRFMELTQSEKTYFYILVNKFNKDLENELKKYQGTQIEIPTLKHPVGQYLAVDRFLKKVTCDVAYFNISEAFNSIAVFAAKHNAVKKICIHSHSSGIDRKSGTVRFVRGGFHRVFRQLLPLVATDFYACSAAASAWMFPGWVIKKGKVNIILNTVNFSEYSYKIEVRESIRRKLGLEGKIVVGHVGSYCYAKNNFFLIDVLKELVQVNRQFRGLLIGSGEDLERVKNYAKEKNIQENILFLGNRDDVKDLLNAMDIFALPSRFEGMPISAVEAQAMGLPCLLSKNISNEVSITENCYFYELKRGAKEWAKRISKIMEMNPPEKRKSADVSTVECMSCQDDMLRNILCVTQGHGQKS